MKVNSIFHVHTFRCGHAPDMTDEECVKIAISHNAKKIYFSDHCPFPDDAFGARMKYTMLDDYIENLLSLKEKYKDFIRIYIGLETEYFKKYEKDGYYQKLKSDKRIDFLLLGQHMAEMSDGQYTFSLKDKSDEYKYLGDAICEGLESGYFNYLAHPDRIFRYNNSWDDDKEKIADTIKCIALKSNVCLEKNLSSIRKNVYYKQFWENLPYGSQIVIGFDAHSLSDIDAGVAFLKNAFIKGNEIYSYNQIPKYSSEKLKQVRKKIKMSQKNFSEYLGISSKTLETWEQEKTDIPLPICRLLEMIEGNSNVTYIY